MDIKILSDWIKNSDWKKEHYISEYQVENGVIEIDREGLADDDPKISINEYLNIGLTPRGIDVRILQDVTSFANIFPTEDRAKNASELPRPKGRGFPRVHGRF